jgi:hypothetical protein
MLESIPCPFSVGWVKRQRNPTHLLGFMLQPNLQIKAFSNLDKVLLELNQFNYSGYPLDAIQSRAQTLRPYRLCDWMTVSHSSAYRYHRQF